jgi:hypothetical protein
LFPVPPIGNIWEFFFLNHLGHYLLCQ